MFNLTGSELIVIVLLGLVVLGPEKLPGAIRRVGRLYLELKRLSSGFQEEFRTAFEEPIRELRSTADSLKSSIENPSTPDIPADAGQSDPADAPSVTNGPDEPRTTETGPQEPTTGERGETEEGAER